LMTPDSALVMVMLTFGNDAPEGSVTVPTMVACWEFAQKEEAIKKQNMKATQRKCNFCEERGSAPATASWPCRMHVELIDITPNDIVD
jgi:hypothetical protein